MNTLVKSSSGIQQISVDSMLLSQRKIFIEGEINPESACEFVKALMVLNAEDTNKYIDCFVNSPGGEMNSGLLIYDAIQSSRAPVRLFCIGRAYSMGAVLFACCRHGRYILPHGELMLHEPLLGNRIGGNSSSIQSISKSLLEMKRMMNRILAGHIGRSEKEVEKMTGHEDHYFNAEECVKAGLADEIVDFAKLLEG